MPVRPISPDALRRANNARVLEEMRKRQNNWGAKTPFNMMKTRQRPGAIGVGVQRPTPQVVQRQRMTMVHQKPPAPKKGIIDKILGK
jgi:hypothetical protein